MSLCEVDGKACDCQPDEGVPCRHYTTNVAKATEHAWRCGEYLGWNAAIEAAAKACMEAHDRLSGDQAAAALGCAIRVRALKREG